MKQSEIDSIKRTLKHLEEKANHFKSDARRDWRNGLTCLHAALHIEAKAGKPAEEQPS